MKSRTVKKVGSSVLGGAYPLAFVGDTAMNLMAGDNPGTAAIKAGASTALFASNPMLFGAYQTATLGTQAAWGYAKWHHNKQQWWNRQYAYNNVIGGNYGETQRAATMRQAAIQQIQGSKLNARSALGGEARIMSPFDNRRY